MMRAGIAGLPYYLGIGSLADVATRADRVCVLNLLGGESSSVSPVGHAFSGGNIVFGTSPGRRGQALRTPIGDVPVFNNVREGLDAGHAFNTGVVYLPPAAVRDGVAELVRVNAGLEKIIIITEKVSVHDAREVRALAQSVGVDVFGGNCLGMADSWNRVRLGGALGGDNPEEALLPGSIAIFSNSGGFTTTIAQYLATHGWGTTTLISSGKDVYIHYSAQDFAIGLAADERTKAAVLYVEPGGYYEQGIDFGKPVVACVVGRWKSRLTRAVGHAGAIAGAGDDAMAKERWFMEAFGTDGIFTAEHPAATAKGAIVTNIADIPRALTMVMALNGIAPDFEKRGDLSLKPWLANDQGLMLPSALRLDPVTAPEPYASQIDMLHRQVGKVTPRQSMKDASGATAMDAASQVTRVHGHSLLDLALQPLEANFALPLVHGLIDEHDAALLSVAIIAEAELSGQPALAAAEATRAAGNSPNTVMAAAAAMIGPRAVDRTLACASALIDLFMAAGLRDDRDEAFDIGSVEPAPAVRALFLAAPDEVDDERPRMMLDAINARGCRSAIVGFLGTLGTPVSRDAVLAAIAVAIAWKPLLQKRISRLTAATMPWYLRLYGTMIGAALPAAAHRNGMLGDVTPKERLDRWTLADLLFLAVTGKQPAAGEAEALNILVGLLISNGPGAISAQGAKGAVSADGPQTPSRVHINKAMMGFLTHTGFSHGGNGFEGITFLLDRFEGVDLADPGDPSHGLDLVAMATEFAQSYKRERRAAREAGGGDPTALPGVNHPVFRGEKVNYDQRERFIARYLDEHGRYNVFHAYYRALVQALHDTGVSPTVFCVNIDGVIAALLLAMLWEDVRAGRLARENLETAAFNIFLFGRMIGAAAEIEDHHNRGRNMDMRTDQSRCQHIV